MAPHDFSPTYRRLGDVPRTDGPYEFGDEVDLVILPFDWNMDDAPYFSYEPGSGRPGLRSPAEVLQIWKDEFDYFGLGRERSPDTLRSEMSIPSILNSL